MLRYVMGNRFDKLFFKSDSSDKQDKISWRCCPLGVLFVTIEMSLILAGIFCSFCIDSMISLFVLAIITVISAMSYK